MGFAASAGFISATRRHSSESGECRGRTAVDETKPADMRDRRFLRYFAKGLLQLGPAGRDWPGFRYTEQEWPRLELYGASVTGPASSVAMISGAVIFILVA